MKALRTTLWSTFFAMLLAAGPALADKYSDTVQLFKNEKLIEFKVEKQVAPYPGNTAPRYPDMLRSANVEGEVLAQFVVDTTGRAEMNTFKVIKSTHDLFTNAVKASLPNMKFYPAEVGGRKVKQLVQMPFQFNLTKGE